jgi:hypothetical protein
VTEVFVKKNKEAIAILWLEVALVFVKKNKEALAILWLEVALVFNKKNKRSSCNIVLGSSLGFC